MLVSRISPFSGLRNEMELDITPEQVDAWLDGVLIQNAFPHLSAEEREFILSGITPAEWDAAFSPPSGEPDYGDYDEFSGEYDDPVGSRDGYD